MRILVIGGTGFIGPPVVRRLAAMGHEVTIFHRGTASSDLPAEHLLGSREDLPRIRPRADVVVDLILSSGAQAEALMKTFRGIAGSMLAASSMDVYRACGVLHGSEEGSLEPVPLTEDSGLRTKLQTYPVAQLTMLKKFFGWVDEAYDKIPVERAILSDPSLPGTVLRLPMVYGPGDKLHRFYPILKRIDDGRRVILFEESVAAWRSPRGYVENVAEAIAIAAVSPAASGRIYNVAETPAFSELDWARKIAVVAGWDGTFVVLPRSKAPAHLIQPGNLAQHWEADSSRIRRELGFHEVVPIEEAIRRTIDWERGNPIGELNPYRFDYAAEDAAVANVA